MEGQLGGKLTREVGGLKGKGGWVARDDVWLAGNSWGEVELRRSKVRSCNIG